MTTFVKSYHARKYYDPQKDYSKYYEIYADVQSATDQARSQAWKNGEDQAVYALIAVVEKPEVVNTATVTEV